MSELLRRGYISALAPQGVPNADIVVTDLTGSKLCSIQVKTRRDIGADGGWHMHAKHEENFNDRLFFAFVDFGKSSSDRPSVFLVPSRVVAEVLNSSHKQWLQNPGLKGKPHKRRTYATIFAELQPYLWREKQSLSPGMAREVSGRLGCSRSGRFEYFGRFIDADLLARREPTKCQRGPRSGFGSSSTIALVSESNFWTRNSR
jgi:hypothetical protein